MSKAIPYIDMHCDTLMHGVGKKASDIFSMPDAMVDLERLSKAGVYAQFFAVFFPPKEGMEKSLGITDDDAYFSAAHTVNDRGIMLHSALKTCKHLRVGTFLRCIDISSAVFSEKRVCNVAGDNYFASSG